MKLLLAFLLSLSLLAGAEAQGKKSGGSSGSKPPSGGGGKFSGGGGSSKPPSGGDKKPPPSGGGGKFSGGGGSSKPPASGDDKKSPLPPSGGGGKFSGGGGSSKPPAGNNQNSGKPPVKRDDEKARANREENSRQKYQRELQASQPPKESYKTKSGKEVKISKDDPVVKNIRNKPSEYFEPAQRRQRIDVHVHQHYRHPYDYYCNQPYYHVGGGYSSAFWWMMMEWSAERRAMWFYHNRDRISQEAYLAGMRDAQVAQQISLLEAKRHARQPGYVDPEFANNPYDMYDDEFIEASYNPRAHVQQHADDDTAGAVLLWILGIAVVGCVVYVLFFRLRFGR